MATITLIPVLKRCPICGSEPYCEQVEPWDRKYGAAPWAVGCYKMIPTEHFVGVNGDRQLDAIFEWNAEADRVAALIANGQYGRDEK